jgi:putative transcriptional regulator
MKRLETRTSKRTKIEIGSILISTPINSKSYFDKTLILITRIDDHGIAGLVLNQRTDLLAGKGILRDHPDGLEVYFGGSTEVEYITYLAGITGNISEKPQSLFWGSSLETLEAILKHNPAAFSSLLFFSGFMQWNCGELERELEKKLWWSGEITFDELFYNNHKNMWNRLVSKYGGFYSALAGINTNIILN